MIKTAAACLAALLLCAACLTKEELDCWYDDVCLSSGAYDPSAGAYLPPPDTSPLEARPR